MIGAARSHEKAQVEAAANAAAVLAKRVSNQADALVAFAELGDGHKTRIVPAPIASDPMPSPQLAAQPGGEPTSQAQPSGQ